MQVRLSSLSNSQKIIQTNHQQSDLSHGCSIQTVCHYPCYRSYCCHWIDNKLLATIFFKLQSSVWFLWICYLSYCVSLEIDHSLCGWEYMFGYFTEPVEPYLRCCSNTHFYPGMAFCSLRKKWYVLVLFWVFTSPQTKSTNDDSLHKTVFVFQSCYFHI